MQKEKDIRGPLETRNGPNNVSSVHSSSLLKIKGDKLRMCTVFHQPKTQIIVEYQLKVEPFEPGRPV